MALVLYDGVCGLCDRTVQWLLDHDTHGRLLFAPLQGPTAAEVLARHPDLPALDTIVLVEGEGPEERVSVRSHAIWGICGHLPSPWSWARGLRVVPAPLSDLGYRLLAALRYRVFGKLDTCRIPTENERNRFLP